MATISQMQMLTAMLCVEKTEHIPCQKEIDYSLQTAEIKANNVRKRVCHTQCVRMVAQSRAYASKSRIKLVANERLLRW